MTKMEEEGMIGGEAKAVVPTNIQNTSPSSKEGGGGARFCGNTPPNVKTDPEAPMSCAGCQDQILDKYYMRVDGKSWHERCVCCATCKKPLSDSCYSKNLKLYCKEDYRRLQYCYRCGSSITGEELVMRVGANSYHVRCFTCDYCNRELNSGDHFHFLSDNIKDKICCKTCYDIDDATQKSPGSDSEESQPDVFSSLPPSHSHLIPPYLPPEYDHESHRHHSVPCGSNGSLSGGRSMQDPKRSKRPRTILTTAQRRKFKASFEISQKPCRKVRETLASETGLTPRVVQVWFQNQRAKMKKLARRQSQGEGGGRRGKRKKDTESDSENEIPSSPGSYTSAPTPHQAQYYSDYQSPSSIQTSPTSTQESSITGYYNPAQHMHGINHNELPYEEYDVNANPFLRHLPPVTSHGLDTSSHLEMQRMISDRASFVSSQEAMDRHHNDDVTGYHSNPEQDVFVPQRHLEAMDLSHEHPHGVTTAENPIDSLMFMQNNFFRT